MRGGIMPINQRLLDAIELGNEEHVKYYVNNQDGNCGICDDYYYYDEANNCDAHCIDVNIQNDEYNNWSLLHYAIFYSKPNIVYLLLNLGADLEVTNTRGMTPLHLAAANGTAEIAEILLDRGADLEATTIKGRTPLHFAVFYNNVKVTKVLLINNADVSAINNHGDTPLDLARRKYSNNKSYKNITELLEKAAHDRTTISSVIEDMTISNTSNGIVDMRNSTTPSLITATTVVPQHLHQDPENTTNLLRSGDSVENGTLDQASSSLSINGNALLMFIGYICTYAYRKMFSTDGPSTVMNAPSLGQDHTLKLS